MNKYFIVNALMVFALGGAIYGVVHLTGSAWAGLTVFLIGAIILIVRAVKHNKSK